METEQRKEIAKKVFEEIKKKYSIDELSCLSRGIGDLMWEERKQKHIEKIKSQRKGAILQVDSGSLGISGERVKLLRKGPKNATIKVMTGKYKGHEWSIGYHWLRTELEDLKKARKRSQMSRNACGILNKMIGGM